MSNVPANPDPTDPHELLATSIADWDRERRECARALHDRPCQALAVARMKLARIARGAVPDDGILDEIEALIGEADREVREVQARLSPPVLALFGVGAAIEELAEHLQRAYGATIEFRDECDSGPLGEAIDEALYACAREALLDALARGRGVVETRCAREDGHFIVRIAGRGVRREPAGADSPEPSCALPLMRVRMAMISGSVRVEATPDGGTVVTLSVAIPVAGDAARGGPR